MNTPSRDARFDLFVSYAHKDNQGQHAGRVTQLVERIKRQFQLIVGRELRVFFDTDEIRTMQDWYGRIQTGLVQSRMMVAVLSPQYFASEFCRHEWAEYVETELAYALPGEGIAPIYVIPHPDFEASPDTAAQVDRWVRDLQRRQYLHWADWWPSGQKSLEEAGIDEALTKLVEDLRDRVTWSEVRDNAPRNAALLRPSPHFKGRREEMRKLRHDLGRTRLGAITAVYGIGGIGKSQLAFAYAWGYGASYPGGRFLIPAAGLVGNRESLVSGLQSAIIDLGECIGVPVSPEERRASPEAAFNRVAQAFQKGEPALFILDNVDDAGLLHPTVLDAALPRGQHLHLLATTRLPATPQNQMTWLPVDALHPDDAEALLDSLYPISLDGDSEWQAAREIVKRLGGHPLALEVVGVYLRDRNDPQTPAALRQPLSYRELLDWLVEEGLSILDGDLAEQAEGKLAGHTQTVLSRLFEPTWKRLSDLERRALEYAALLPPDIVPLVWLRALLLADFPDQQPDPRRGDPIAAALGRLHALRLLTVNPDQTDSAPRDVARIHRVLQQAIREWMGAVWQNEERMLMEIHNHVAVINNSGYLLPGAIPQVEAAAQVVRERQKSDSRVIALTAIVLSTPLSQLGRTPLALELVLFAQSTLQRQAESDPAIGEWQRALWMSFSKLVDLATAQGNLPEAQRLVGEAFRIVQRLADSDSANAEWQLDLSSSFNQLGNLARAQGNLPEAQRLFGEALCIRQRLAESDPANAEWQRDLSVSFSKLGDLATAQGILPEAQRLFGEALCIVQRLADSAPANALWQRDLSLSFNKLGNLARAQGNLPEAQRLFGEALRIVQRLADSDSINTEWQHDLSVSFEKLGDLAMAQGNLPEAQRLFGEVLRIAQRLTESDPTNAAWQHYLSVSFEKLGELATSQGNLPNAERYFGEALRIRQRLADSDPANAAWQRALSVSFIKLGELATSQGELSLAQWWFGESLRIAQRLAKSSPTNAEWQRDLSVLHYKLAMLALENGDEAGCEAELRKCFNVQEQMKQRGLHFDAPMAQVYQQLAGMFGG